MNEPDWVKTYQHGVDPDNLATQLTKRELIAISAMQAILREVPDWDIATMAADSVAMADALLLELAKVKP